MKKQLDILSPGFGSYGHTADILGRSHASVIIIFYVTTFVTLAIKEF
jgi:hypothetical protein